MDLLDRLSEDVIQWCLESLEGLWLISAQPGDDLDSDDRGCCPNCGADQCQLVTILHAIRDDLCTGRFERRCALCGFSGVVYGRVYAPETRPRGKTRGEVSLQPYTIP